MKTLYILFIGLLVSGGVMAQSCLPEGIIFETQAQIDSFQINYPNCTEIEGDVLIQGNDIANLNGLNVLTTILGTLSIDGYESFGNLALTNLTGLDNVTFIGGNVDIVWNDALTNLTGLNNLTSSGGCFGIAVNAALTSLSGLEGLTTVGGFLAINYNDILKNLDELESLNSIGGDLEIIDNATLTSLSGLDNINPESIGNLLIYENQLLSDCEILSICNYLVSPNGTIEIYNNATGCNSPEEVQDSCEANAVLIDEQLLADKVLIFPNPSSTHITIELPQNPQKNTLLSIYNLNGQQLITQPITEPQTAVDVSGLPSGVYFVKVMDDESVMMGKVVVE